MGGRFITFEGPEGSGKTSVMKAVAATLAAQGHEITTTREPGGIKIAEQIRKVLLDVDNTEMDARTEALLFAASRRQHMVEKVLPALNAGRIVLCDRFVDSSLAYQGVGRDLGIHEVYAINQFAIHDCLPDLTVFIDVPPSIGLKRVFDNGRDIDRLDVESARFHEKVYRGYQEIMATYPTRIKQVDGTQSLEKVTEAALSLIQAIL